MSNFNCPESYTSFKEVTYFPLPKMLTPQVFILLLIEMTQVFTGIFINGFIVAVNITDFIKKRKISPLDLLISCLATSRICVQVLIFLVHLVFISFIKQSVLPMYYTPFMFVNICGLWLATWLGVFYCTKIVTVPHPLLFWLKKKISKLVPWLILGSLLYASISTGIYSKYTWTFTQKFFINSLCKNATQPKGMNVIPLSLLIQITVPLIIFLITILLLIFSLGRHTQKMRTIAASTRDQGRGASFRPILSILSFLVLYVFHYTAAILFFFQILQFGSFLYVFCSTVADIYPCIHSVILILGNPKLKQNAKIFLCRGQCSQ